mmetsp:Transcript_45096/g.125014  ORF Transcript_45096/g.125014 Transcript_45096/m.125014 type:complete len:883 (-) Transcript_45096:73-2721(-)
MCCRRARCKRRRPSETDVELSGASASSVDDAKARPPAKWSEGLGLKDEGMVCAQSSPGKQLEKPSMSDAVEMLRLTDQLTGLDSNLTGIFDVAPKLFVEASPQSISETRGSGTPRSTSSQDASKNATPMSPSPWSLDGGDLCSPSELPPPPVVLDVEVDEGWPCISPLTSGGVESPAAAADAQGPRGLYKRQQPRLRLQRSPPTPQALSSEELQLIDSPLMSCSAPRDNVSEVTQQSPSPPASPPTSELSSHSSSPSFARKSFHGKRGSVFDVPDSTQTAEELTPLEFGSWPRNASEVDVAADAATPPAALRPPANERCASDTRHKSASLLRRDQDPVAQARGASFTFSLSKELRLEQTVPDTPQCTAERAAQSLRSNGKAMQADACRAQSVAERKREPPDVGAVASAPARAKRLARTRTSAGQSGRASSGTTRSRRDSQPRSSKRVSKRSQRPNPVSDWECWQEVGPCLTDRISRMCLLPNGQLSDRLFRVPATRQSTLTLANVKRIFRCSLKLSEQELSDDRLKELFHRLDTQGTGFVDASAFLNLPRLVVAEPDVARLSAHGEIIPTSVEHVLELEPASPKMVWTSLQRVLSEKQSRLRQQVSPQPQAEGWQWEDGLWEDESQEASYGEQAPPTPSPQPPPSQPETRIPHWSEQRREPILVGPEPRSPGCEGLTNFGAGGALASTRSFMHRRLADSDAALDAKPSRRAFASLTAVASPPDAEPETQVHRPALVSRSKMEDLSRGHLASARQSEVTRVDDHIPEFGQLRRSSGLRRSSEKMARPVARRSSGERRDEKQNEKRDSIESDVGRRWAGHDDLAILADGSSVLISGIISAPELNGQIARILRWKEEKGRYRVELPGGVIKLMRPQNLVSLPEAQ